MGQGDIGGNGSVEWTINADHPVGAVGKPTGRRGGYQYAGVDMTRTNQESFTISVLPPKNGRTGRRMKPAAYLDLLRDPKSRKMTVAGPRVQFKLPIDDHSPDQIRVSWPKSKKQPVRRKDLRAITKRLRSK